MLDGEGAAAKSSANAAVRDGPVEDDDGAGAEIAERIRLRWIACAAAAAIILRRQAQASSIHLPSPTKWAYRVCGAKFNV